jgi:hypothetical protein
MARSASLERAIPALVYANYDVTSPIDPAYNCAAWAVDDSIHWLDPTDQAPCVWPEGLPRADVSIANFEQAYELHGFTLCHDGTLEDGFDKIAIYGWRGDFQHVARQLDDGKWASKCGPLEDIVHDKPEELEGDADLDMGYGQIAAFMRRAKGAVQAPITLVAATW